MQGKKPEDGWNQNQSLSRDSGFNKDVVEIGTSDGNLSHLTVKPCNFIFFR